MPVPLAASQSYFPARATLRGRRNGASFEPRDPRVPWWQFFKCHLHAYLLQLYQAIEWCNKSAAGIRARVVSGRRVDRCPPGSGVGGRVELGRRPTGKRLCTGSIWSGGTRTLRRARRLRCGVHDLGMFVEPMPPCPSLASSVSSSSGRPRARRSSIADKRSSIPSPVAAEMASGVVSLASCS